MVIDVRQKPGINIPARQNDRMDRRKTVWVDMIIPLFLNIYRFIRRTGTSMYWN